MTETRNNNNLTSITSETIMKTVNSSENLGTMEEKIVSTNIVDEYIESNRIGESKYTVECIISSKNLEIEEKKEFLTKTLNECKKDDYMLMLRRIAECIISSKNTGIEEKKELMAITLNECKGDDYMLMLGRIAECIISSKDLKIEEKKELLVMILDEYKDMKYIGALGYTTMDILESNNLKIEEKEEFLIDIIDTYIRMDTEVTLNLAKKIIDKSEKIIDIAKDKLSEEKKEHFIKRLGCLKNSASDKIESKSSPNEVQLKVINSIIYDVDEIINSMEEKCAKGGGKLIK